MLTLGLTEDIRDLAKYLKTGDLLDLPLNHCAALFELRDRPLFNQIDCAIANAILLCDLPIDVIIGVFQAQTDLPVKVAVVATLASKRFRSVAPQCAWCGPDCSGSCTGAYNAGLCR